ncbi:MAG TPA: serine/threonine-protein kinase [Phycisphaerae bacterium]|jgi:serine/threonine protein kinase/WD40 repeat protein
MNDAARERVKELLTQAAALPVDRRALFVGEHASDPAVAREALALLATLEDSAFMSAPTVSAGNREPGTGNSGWAPGTAAALGESVGDRIGRYKLLQKIGEGGFGTVFMAEQIEPVVRRIALKIIKLGMDTRQVIARFEAERQALALMDHPNIARVLDAGATESGRPYFVMELVRGEPVTAYCDGERLSLRQRLDLFRDICNAVQHAHQKGIIHRDIKPTNVLVTIADGAPLPKIIDFGIAKATTPLASPLEGGTTGGLRLTDKTLFTELQQLIGTPEYMSPEQAEVSGVDIDTRSDVYALGVLLFELLTGGTPFDGRRLRAAPLAEIQRIIREEEPPRPSTRVSRLSEVAPQARGISEPQSAAAESALRAADATYLQSRAHPGAPGRSEPGSSVIEIARCRRTEPPLLRRALRGDLDWIVMKCLEKDRRRRYATASALADDVGRYLDHQPVLATPPSAGYKLRKFVRRNRVPVAVTAMFLLMLVVSSAVAWWLYGTAERARRLASDKTQHATRRLWDSLLAQARAGSSSMRPGRRFESLEAIRQAAAIRPSPELRDEAIACMTLADIVPVKTFHDVPNASAHGLTNLDRFAYLSPEDEIHVVAIEDGRLLHRLEGKDHTYLYLQFSPDGRYLVAKYTIKHTHFIVDVWDLQSSALLLSRDTGSVDPGFAFSPATEWLALSEPDQLVHFYRLPSGDEFKALSFGPELNKLQTHPSGELMAASALEPPYVRVWDIVNDQFVFKFDMPAAPLHLDWSHDGRLLAAGDINNGRIYVWDAQTSELRCELAGHQGAVTFVYFHPQAGLLASRSWDYTSRFWDLRTQREVLGSLQGWFVQGFADLFACRGEQNKFAIWRFEPARELRRLWAPSPFTPWAGVVQFAPDGGRLVSAATNGVWLWDVETGEHLASLSEQPAVWAEILSDKHTVLGATRNGLVRWSLFDDGGTVQLRESELLWPQEGIQGCCLNPTKRTAIVALPKELVFFDLDTRRERRRLLGFSGMRMPTVSPNGRWIFVNNWKGSGAHLWDTDSGEMMREFHGDHVRGFFSPDGRWLLVSNRPEFLLCEVGSWKVSRRIQRLHPESVAGAAAFSNDGTMVALAHSMYTIQLIELATGEVLATLPNPDQYALLTLSFSQDDRWLAAATVDRLIEVWDLQRLREGLHTIGLDW